MNRALDLPVKVRDYLDEVIRLAHERSPDVVSISVFGSIAKGEFLQTVSDVDLIIALADGVSQKTKRIISKDLAALELKHGLRERLKSKRELVYSKFDWMAAQFKSHFVCYKRDLLAGDSAAFAGVNPLAQSLLLSTEIGFAAIVTSARTIWGDDFLHQARIPVLTKAHLLKSCVGFLLLNAFALLGYPILPNATKYSMSALKWMLHSCYFCYTLESATIEKEVDFFLSKFGGEDKAFLELMSLRREYRPSLTFIKNCFQAIVQLCIVTRRENEFPITVRAK